MKAHLIGPIGGYPDDDSRIIEVEGSQIRLLEEVRDHLGVVTFIRTREVDEHGCTVFVRR